MNEKDWVVPLSSGRLLDGGRGGVVGDDRLQVGPFSSLLTAVAIGSGRSDASHLLPFIEDGLGDVDPVHGERVGWEMGNSAGQSQPASRGRGRGEWSGREGRKEAKDEEKQESVGGEKRVLEGWRAGGLEAEIGQRCGRDGRRR